MKSHSFWPFVLEPLHTPCRMLHLAEEDGGANEKRGGDKFYLRKRKLPQFDITPVERHIRHWQILRIECEAKALDVLDWTKEEAATTTGMRTDTADQLPSGLGRDG